MPSTHNLPHPRRFNKVLLNIFDSHKSKIRTSLAPKIAKDFVRELKSRIRSQSFQGWAPLNADYKEWKRTHGYDTRTLIKTGEYIENITWYLTPKGNVVVGFRKRTHSGSGLPLKKLARILEYGSAKAGIPGRAHWGPTIEYIRQKYKI